MSDFWNYTFDDSANFMEVFDELPLWSSAFGLFLLNHLELKANQKVLDLGSGAGFPILELAERLGSSCTCYGLDPWKNANERAKKKIKVYNIHNVEILEGSGEKIPFENDDLDLIVSNLGINNFENPDVVFKECNRVLKKGSRLVLTTNLLGHWKEFYAIFEETIRENGDKEMQEQLASHQAHRGTISTISKLFTENGFKISRHFEETFEMRFLNGSAFLNHHFIKVGWLSSWLELVPKNNWPVFFKKLESNLNTYAERHGGLNLTVPMAYLEGQKL